MKISVVLASRDGAGFLTPQLSSILGQTRAPDELIIGDDASTDDTLALARRLTVSAGVPTTIIPSAERLGVVANFERIIRAAHGDVIVLSDQDDVWNHDKLAVVEHVFDRRPLLGGMFSDGRIIDATGSTTGSSLWETFGFGETERRRAAEGGLLGPLLRRNVVTGATMAFRADRRELLLPIGRAGLHDSWIALLLAATDTLEAVPRRLIDYRVHVDNLEGLGIRRLRPAIAQRRSGGPLRELAQFEMLLERLRQFEEDRLIIKRPLEGSIGVSADASDLLHRKVRHLRFRVELSRDPVRRAGQIVRSLPEYRRFGSSWRSPLFDLMAPSALSAPRR